MLLKLTVHKAWRPCCVLHIAALVSQVAARDISNSDFWAGAEVAEVEDGQGVETLCESSFLQTSLHTESRLAPAPVGQQPQKSPSRGAPSVEPAREGKIALSFFQVDETEDVVVTDASQIAKGSATATLLQPAGDDAGIHSQDHRLRWAMLLVKLMLAFAITVKGGTAFIRLVLRRQEKPHCKNFAPEVPSVSKFNREASAAVPLVTADEVDTLLPLAEGGYDCALSKPRSVGRPLRFRARIHGPVQGHQSLLGPLTQEACVHYHAVVKRKPQDTDKASSDQSSSVLVDRSDSVDFVATLEGAPGICLTIRAIEVKMQDMCYSRRTETMALAAAPGACCALAREAEGCLKDDETLHFEEEALRVGELITLVGDLHRDASGALLLWPASRSREHSEALPQAAASYFDGVHVLASDNPSFLGPPETVGDAAIVEEHFIPAFCRTDL
eukprot:gb/GFBE01040760.1/.p1 GENE.gb/GFBE01040760.1/~~gb/GFBE01040760.1/.p1  ORF type:complete len:444 (+),score=90.49 gb/GFBE01040760.1/:1-1332(+)